MTDQERLGPPPVEPLSDIAWARVERELWARVEDAAPVAPRTRTRSWIAITGSIVAVAAVVAIVLATRSGGGELDASPARVVSGAAPSSVSFGDAHVTLDPETAVVMSRDLDAPSALLERGAAWFTIAPRRGAPFVVVAGDTIVRVVGTRFRVARYLERATVEVEHGLVEVQFRGTKVVLRADQSWSSDHPSDAIATKLAQREPEPADSARATEPPPEHPTPVKPPVIKPAIVTPDSPSRKPKVDPPKPDPVDLDRVTFERLQTLEVRDPGAALAGYLELSKRTGPWTEVALFAAGRLAADRREPRAAALLNVYLTRFPRGKNADDARELLAHLKGEHR